MKYTFLMFVFFTAILFSFGQEKTDTGAFTELKVANKIYIELISSTEDKIEFVYLKNYPYLCYVYVPICYGTRS